MALAPSSTNDPAFQAQVRMARSQPMIGREDEPDLIAAAQAGDERAKRRLTGGYLRLVIKIAMTMRGYGLPLAELVSAGNMGLWLAITKFDRTRCASLATPALWYIRAEMQEYILANWSLVRIGSQAEQKKLFYKLRRTRQVLEISESDHSPESLQRIADELNVSVKSVREMSQRLLGDCSLNGPIGGAEDSYEWMDMLADDSIDIEAQLAQREEHEQRRVIMHQAMQTLLPRERQILICRRLREPNQTLEEIAARLGISRERVRQIEVRSFQRLQAEMLRLMAKGVAPCLAVGTRPAAAATDDGSTEQRADNINPMTGQQLVDDLNRWIARMRSGGYAVEVGVDDRGLPTVLTNQGSPSSRGRPLQEKHK